MIPELMSCCSIPTQRLSEAVGYRHSGVKPQHANMLTIALIPANHDDVSHIIEYHL